MSRSPALVPLVVGGVALLLLLVCGAVVITVMLVQVESTSSRPSLVVQTFASNELPEILPAAPENVRIDAELPQAVSGQSLGDRDISGDLPLIEILVTGERRDTTLWISGRRTTLDQLKETLATQADRVRETDHPMLISGVGVVITAEPAVSWREIQWVIQCCADPSVRIYRIYFTAQSPTGQERFIPVFLPLDRGILKGERPPPVPTVVMKRTRDQTETRVFLFDELLGDGNAGIELLAPKLRMLREARDSASARVDAFPWVPFEDLVGVVDLLRQTGFGEITFTGAPPPGTKEGYADEEEGEDGR
jgi:biopolymer transport protein ExbD